MTKLLRWAVHTLEIFMWPQDYLLSPAGNAPDHTVQDIPCYNETLPDQAEELYLALLEYFEPGSEDF